MEDDLKEVVNENKVDNEGINDQQQTESNLNHFKTLLEIDLECKGYIDSLIDKKATERAKKQFEKRIKVYEEQQKIKAEEEQKATAEQQRIKAYERKILELQQELEYREVLESYNLPSELSKFVADENKEKTIENIEFFLQIMDKYAIKKIKEKLIEDPPIPKKSEGEAEYNKSKLWRF